MKCPSFAANIFKCIFCNEIIRIPVDSSLKIFPSSPVHKKSALVQVMAWH